MIKTINCQGLPCPKPVLEVNKALKEGGFDTLVIQVDNLTAKENLLRLATSQNLDAAYVEKDFGFEVTINVNEESVYQKTSSPTSTSDTAYIIKSQYLGDGDDELGGILMNGFLFTLTQTEPYPSKIVLLNSAVNLSTTNVEAIRHLQDLHSKGTEIYSCGTCLNFYNLTEKLQVGLIGNMYDVVESLSSEGNKITL